MMRALGDVKRCVLGLIVVALLGVGLLFGVEGVLAERETRGSYLESYIELLRSDLRTQKAALIASNMYFTRDEAAAFWPVYRDYEFELSKANDGRIAVLRDYVRDYQSMDDAKAADLTQRWFDAENQRMRLRQRYFDRFSEVLPGKTVARFYQVERRIDLLIDVQVASELPMVKKQ
jgi:hypothetical protein